MKSSHHPVPATWVCVGAGNLAWSLIPALMAPGGNRVMLFARSKEKEKLFSEAYPQLEIVSSLTDLPKGVGVLLTVPDDALPEVSHRLIAQKENLGWIAHCAGSQPLSVLSAFGDKAGVLYPLQTFTLGKQVDWAEVPVFVEGMNPDFLDFTQAVFPENRILNSQDRLQVHLAAVWASNFANAVLGVGMDLLPEGLDAQVLAPLVKEQIRKSFALGGRQAQTGPAKRGDRATIQKHLAMLAHDPALARLYRLLTRQIAPEYEIFDTEAPYGPLHGTEMP